GVDYRPFVLQVRDAKRKAVARVAVDGRKVVDLCLPVRAGRTERFWFHVEGGGQPIATDPRIMNFAAFRCFWSHERPAPLTAAEVLEPYPYGSDRQAGNGTAIAAASPHGPSQSNGLAGEPETLPLHAEGAGAPAEQDIAPVELGLRFGHGWSALKQENGESYRWVENGPDFTMQGPSD